MVYDLLYLIHLYHARYFSSSRDKKLCPAVYSFRIIADNSIDPLSFQNILLFLLFFFVQLIFFLVILIIKYIIKN